MGTTYVGRKKDRNFAEKSMVREMDSIQYKDNKKAKDLWLVLGLNETHQSCDEE